MERRLAAILAADVVGYSRLMERAEADTFERLRAHRKALIEPEIAKHNGRIFKLMGDGLLAEFGSVVDAVECAAAIQQSMAEADLGMPEDSRIALRIGVHVGDVIVEGEDRHGDAVNIAARLQEVAEPGGVCVSRAVVDHARHKVAFGFEPRGEQRLKNIAEAIAVYALRPAGAAARQAPPLPDKPSIAVLPFNNLSGDPEQDYFADGMVEEIITALSRMRWLFVIARNSSFTYKGRAVDVKQVGRELGVRYVLEGSVRKAGNKVRITGQLVEAETGAHLWADRFDGALEDIFDLQDQVTASVVGAIAPRLEQAEIKRAERKPTDSLDAYDYYLRGLAAVHRWTREANDEALSLFRRAIELDPAFAPAYGMAARCYSQRKVSGWVADRAQEIAEAEWLARRAAELGRDDAVALTTAGIALGYVVGDLDTGIDLIERALQLNPNLAWGWLVGGWLKIWLGEPEVALQYVARAIRLSPHDPQIFNMQAAAASAHFFAGRYSEASSWAEMAVRDNPYHMMSSSTAAASHALAGRLAEAQRALARLREIDPALRVSNLHDFAPVRRPEDLDRLAEGLRKAGLPE
ncbi:MAG: CadC-family transcriptional regulator [Rhodospirillales bacterium]|nr:CadC-family transcriptional regulator [Rhodospirillales bacterium]